MSFNLLAATFGGVAVACAASALLYRPLFVEGRLESRNRRLLASAPVSILGQQISADKARREMLAGRLSDIARLERAAKRPSLKGLLVQAGLDWTPTQFRLGVAGILAVILVVFWAVTGNFLLATGIALAAGVFIPKRVLNWLRNKRMLAFLRQLPDALEAMARAMRSGQHLNTAVEILVRESQDPLRTEFRQVAEEQGIGATLPDALERMSLRLPIEETKLLALAVSIQSEEGGGLSVTLQNLADTMRSRYKLSEKIAAMTAESRAGAGLLAALPVVVMVAGYLQDPEAGSLLWTTTIGQIALVVCFVWLGIGFVVMNRIAGVKV